MDEPIFIQTVLQLHWSCVPNGRGKFLATKFCESLYCRDKKCVNICQIVHIFLILSCETHMIKPALIFCSCFLKISIVALKMDPNLSSLHILYCTKKISQLSNWTIWENVKAIKCFRSIISTFHLYFTCFIAIWWYRKNFLHVFLADYIHLNL